MMRRCMPHEMVQGYCVVMGHRMTSLESSFAEVERGRGEGGGWGKVSQLSMGMVGVSGNIAAVELNFKKHMDAIDQKHKASVSEVSKMMMQSRLDFEASERFGGASGSAASAVAAS